MIMAKDCERLGSLNYDYAHIFANDNSIIQANAEVQWLVLPPQFRLEGLLKLHDRKPVERDFVVGAKLTHLHVLFLVQLALARQVPKPSSELVSISVKMLGLVVEAIVLKDSLSNSGTSLVWKESKPLTYEPQLTFERSPTLGYQLRALFASFCSISRLRSRQRISLGLKPYKT